MEVVGSDTEGIISNQGKITIANIEEKEVTILVEMTSETDPEDVARRNFTVTVPAKYSFEEDLFGDVTEPNEKPVIIPSIQEWYGYEGNFAVNSDTKIIINDVSNVNLVAVAENMQADLKEIIGYELSIEEGNRDFAASPVVKTSPSKAGGAGSIP